jgi:hypothetical protein
MYYMGLPNADVVRSLIKHKSLKMFAIKNACGIRLSACPTSPSSFHIDSEIRDSLENTLSVSDAGLDGRSAGPT